MVGGRYTNIQVFQYFNCNVTYQFFNICYTRLLYNVCYYIGYGSRQIVLLKSSFNYISFDLTVMVLGFFFLFKDVPDTAVSPQRKKQRKKHKRGWYLIRIKVQCTSYWQFKSNYKAILLPKFHNGVHCKYAIYYCHYVRCERILYCGVGRCNYSWLIYTCF